MPASYNDKNVECPFYCYVKRAENNKNTRVVCEGISGARHVDLQFAVDGQMNTHLSRYCCKAYEACPVYTMLSKKYQ